MNCPIVNEQKKRVLLLKINEQNQNSNTNIYKNHISNKQIVCVVSS